MRFIRAWLSGTSLLGAFTLVLILGAAEIPGSFEAVLTVEMEEVTVGDPIQATLTVLLSPGVRLQAPEIPRKLGRFSVGEIHGPEQSRQRDGRTRITYRFPVTVFRPGRQTLPSIRLQGEEGDSEIPLEARTEPVAILVASVLDGSRREIADIKDVASLPTGGGLWWLLGSVLAAAALAVWAFRRMPTTHPVKVDVVPEPPVPAHEWAHRRLRELLSSSLLSKGKIKGFYIELAEILKEFLNRRFRIVTAERTTDELIVSLGKTRSSRQAVPGCRQILTRCDLVKFARLRPADPETRAAVDLTFRLVAESRQVDPATTPLGPGPHQGASPIKES